MNIARLEHLADIVERIGLPRDEAIDVLVSRQFREAIDEDWKRSRTMRITGVPTFNFSGRIVEGAQPYEALEEVVRDAGVRAR